MIGFYLVSLWSIGLILIQSADLFFINESNDQQEISNKFVNL